MPEEDRTLLQSQKNQVAALVTAAGLTPSAFQWLSLRTDFRWVSKLEHKASKFFYTFDYVTNQYEGEQPLASYSPGDDSRTVEQWLNDWNEHAEHLVDWLSNLRRELEAPDLWSASETLASDVAEIGRNEPFTADERALLVEQLGVIRSRIEETYELTASQAEVVEARLDYLESAASRVGRFDWRGLVVSVIYGIVWDLAFNPTQARQLAAFFVEALAGLVQSLTRLPH